MELFLFSSLRYHAHSFPPANSYPILERASSIVRAVYSHYWNAFGLPFENIYIYIYHKDFQWLQMFELDLVWLVYKFWIHWRFVRCQQSTFWLIIRKLWSGKYSAEHVFGLLELTFCVVFKLLCRAQWLWKRYCVLRVRDCQLWPRSFCISVNFLTEATDADQIDYGQLMYFHLYGVIVFLPG